jgi:hypothetical protein
MSPVSTIRLTFDGMLLLFMNDGREFCIVQFLKNIEHHVPELLITKIPRAGAADVLLHLSGAAAFKDQCWLDVQRTPQRPQRVRLRFDENSEEPFERVETDTNRDDFRWAVNLEGREVYNTQLSLLPHLVRPSFRINEGTFYTQTLSNNELTKKVGAAGGTELLGKVAVQIGAEIGLGSRDTAFFSNGLDGEQRELKPETGIDYGILVKNSRPQGHEDHSIDANNYHPVVASNIAPSRKITFARRPENRATPDAVCLPGWMGTSV